MDSAFLFLRYNLAAIQPELFLAEVVSEQPPAEGSAGQRTTGERVCPLVPVTQSTQSTHSSHLTQQKPEETDKFSFSIYKEKLRILWQLHEPFCAIVPTELNIKVKFS